VRQKTLYKETYKAPGLKLRADYLPTLPSATGFVVKHAFILTAGKIEIEGVRYEYQDVRMLLQEIE